MAKKPCIYTLKDGRVLSYDEMRSYILEQEAKAPKTLAKEQQRLNDIAKKLGIKPLNFTDLYNANRRLFGLKAEEAFASAVVMDRMVGTMAERAGISKDAMYEKLDFQKTSEAFVKGLSDKGKVLWQIVGENAQLAQDIRNNLQVARNMETVGKNAKTIRLATGWEKGKDGKWRYEIEDYIQSVSDVYDLQGKSKGEVIVNTDTLVSKELNKLYPQLKDVSVKINIDSKNDNQGSYETVTINNQKQLKYNQITVNATDVAKAQSILLHEIQHAIQDIEGFAKGGSPENALNILRAELIDAVKNLPKYKELTEKRENLIKQGKSIFSDEVAQVEKQRDNFLMQYAGMQTKSGRWSEAKFNTYKRLAGEVEARNVEKRMGMTPEQRRATLLSETEDVARDEQIVLFDSVGIQMQIDAWHGSPYQFDKFTTQAIGTGEGAQAFGWGLYFTDLESIARNYAEKLAKQKMKIVTDGRTINVERDVLTNAEEIAYVTLEQDYDVEKAIKRLEYNQSKRPNPDNLIAIDILKRTKVEGVRSIYKVSLHKGKTPDQYTWLEWYKIPTKKQIATILEALEEDDFYKKRIKEYVFDYEKIKRADSGYGGNAIYESLSAIVGGDKQASLFLLENGIDGIKYPAESISRGATSDTARGFNYVVFDENAVSIEEVIKFQKDAEKARGAMMISMDGQAIIYALADPNVSTPLHEIAHVFEHYLNNEEKSIVQNWANTKGWTTETDEKFARGFEKYLAEGKAPSKDLQAIFDKFKQWLTDIYNGIKDSEIDIELNDEMRAIYAKMLGAEGKTKTEPKAETKAKEETGEKKKPKEVKRTIIGKRAYDEETNENLREKLKEKGLYRNVKDPSIAMESAKEFVDENGLDATIAILNYDNVIHLDNQVALSGYAMVAAKNEMADAKTPEEYEIAQMKYAEVVHLMDKIGNKIGTELNMFRQVYKMLEHENIAFNTKKLVNEYKTAFKKKFKDLYGDAIPPSIEKQFDDLHDKLKNNQEKLEELNKKIAEKEAHISLLEIQEEAKKESKSTDERKAKAREKLRDGLSEMFGALASLSGGKISAVESDESFTRGARKAIEAIMEETSITFEEAYKKLRQTIIDRGYSADKLDELKENISSEYQSNDKTEGTLGLSKKRLKELALEVDMSSGVTPEQQVQQYVDLVRKEIESDYPNITDKEIRDEISGYGKTIKESQDDASKRLSKLKNMLRSVSQLVDISQGVRPLKSGFQRNPTDQDVRSLFKKVREQLKTLPIDPITRDGLLKTAMDAYKRRLTNRIADIQKEIDTRTRIRKEKNVLVDDAETIKLKDTLKLKKDEYQQIFGEEIAEEKLEKRNKNREAFLQKKIKEKQDAIDNLIEIEKNTTVKSSAYSKEISILQNELKDLNDIYNSVFEEKILQRKIEDLNEKIAKAREKRIERNLETSEEKALRIEREKLEAKRKELTNAQIAAKIVKEEPLTDAEQLALANKKIDATIKSKENKLLKEIARLEQEIATETREQKIKFPSQPYSKTISDRQKRLKELKEIHENLFADEIKERKEQEKIEKRNKNRESFLQKKIDALDEALTNMKAIEKSQRPSSSAYSAQIAQKQKELDDLKELYNRVFKSEIDAQQQDSLIKAKENQLLKQIAKLEEEIASGIMAQKNRTASQPYSQTISDRQSRLKELKEIHEGLFADEIKQRKEQAKLEASKKNIRKRIAELERKIRDKDFAKKPKQKQLMDDEKKKLLIEKENLKEEFDNLLYQHEFENRTIAQKAYDNFVEAPVRLLQTIQTAIDFGLIGVQLSAAISRQAITDPKKLAQNFKNAIIAFGSPEFAEQQKNAIKSDSEYETAKEAELSLVGMRNEKTEFQSDLLDLIFKKLVLVMGGDEKLSEILSPKAFERFNQVLGNSIRYDLFKKASVAAKGLGYTIEEDKKVFLDIAGTFNSFTGRASIGNLKALNKTLSLLLFSPKNWASMFKTATPYGLIKFFNMGGNPILENRNFIYDSPAKREAVKSFMSLFAVATTYALLNALRYNNDDDEDTWVNTTDPDKADFMKVSERLKDGSIIYTDFFGGRLNMMVTQVKLLQALRGETITTTQGKERDTTPFEILENHALNKAAPFPSYVLKMAQYDWDRDETGELVAYSKYSKEPVDLMARTAESFYPMALTDIYQIVQSEPTFLNGLDMIKVSLGVSQVQSKSEQSRRQIKKSNGDIINIPDIDKSIERKLNGL